jgi:activator of HSP90 ATPase
MAQDGYISGKNLQVVTNKLIVQTWRASDWQKTEVDSTFILHFETKGNDVLLHVTHANLPDNQAYSINKGWYDYYWKPWKHYLTRKKNSG